jgi:uncharacterized RDD family membrane protein YckC
MHTSFCGCHTSWFTHTFDHRPSWIIAHWEAINIFVALQVFSHLFQGQLVTIWRDSMSVLQAGRSQESIFQVIARNIWLWLSSTFPAG